MSKEIDWSKAPEGATHYLPESEDYFASWIKPGFSMREESQLDWVEDDHNGAEHLHVARPKVWNGEGLPPAGTVCEFRVKKSRVVSEFEKVRVQYLSEYTFVGLRLNPKNGAETEVICHPSTANFRPIRTAEQIEADNREASIAEMVSSAIYQSHAITPAQAKITCGRLYDAGYRKCSE